MMHRVNPPFYLEIRLTDQLEEGRIRKFCHFTLSYGTSSHCDQLEYRPILGQRYREWQQAYRSYYEALPSPDVEPVSSTSMRAEVVMSGRLTPLKQKKSQLQQAESTLLNAFFTWLQNGELQTIRETLEEASAKLEVDSDQFIDVFLSFHRDQGQEELRKLPWEAWKISRKVELSGKVRLSRTPVNRSEPVQINTVRRSWARILAICAEDKYLRFEEDIHVLRNELESSVEIQVLDINSRQSHHQILERIRDKLSDKQGWDILFFAGHSGEAPVGGGELRISEFSISMQSLAPEIEKARKRGLQFAIFNSCNGLDIAESLLNLGLNQVVVMREEISNEVANAFLQEFASQLKSNYDVHTAVIKACDGLSRSQDYQSAHLIPCLFRRPGSKLFQIPPRRQRWLRLFRPKRYEAVGLSLLTLASLFTPLQQGLLDKRVYMQSFYRNISPSVVQQPEASPPLVLLQIDERSIQEAMKEAGTQARKPLPQGYLTKIVKALANSQAEVVGIDYLLDSWQESTTLDLGKAINIATTQGGTQFVFGCSAGKISDPYKCDLYGLPQIVGANINADSVASHAHESYADYYVPLLWDENQSLPFAYWLAWLHSVCVAPHTNQDSCSASESIQLRIAKEDINKTIPRLNRSWVTAVGDWLNELWKNTAGAWLIQQRFHPITDFSIPPNEVYQKISAEDFLKNPTSLAHQAVLIAAGGYDEAGAGDNSDTFRTPQALKRYADGSEITRGEHHAYLFYLFLNRRLVIPIPDLWMVWLAAFGGKSVVLLLQWHASKDDKKLNPSLYFWALPAGTIVYGLFSLELYCSSAAVLLPILLPVVVFWAYVLPPLIKREI
jgi:hypothetical protein